MAMGFAWAKRMRASFGAAFLWLVTLIYFTQGFRSFVWTAVSYQMKDVLKLSPSASQFVVSVAYFPWSIKPIYGLLSDCIPIRGRRRVPYLFIATILSLFPWVVLSVMSSMRSSQNSLIGLLTIQSLGSAMADVVIDAMVAEAVRSECTEFAGDLQTLSWLSMAFGGICGSLLGGYTMDNLKIETIYLLFSVLPATQLLSCALLKEAPLRVQKVQSQNKQDKMTFGQDSRISKGNGFSKEITDASRSRKNIHKNGKRKKTIVKSETQNKHGSLISGYYLSLKSAAYGLLQAFKQPIILRPMAWFFISLATIPNLSTIMFYYQTEVLHMEASFLGTARVIGWFGLMLGTYLYNCYFKRMRLRLILMLAHFGLAIITVLDIVLVSRFHIQFSIPDKYMLLWGSALGDAINQFKMMPFLLLSGQLCPPGIEGTLFALFMSINNLGSTLGSFVGAVLASVLNISSESFDNLIYGLFIQLVATIFPVALLFLIPKEATGLSSQ